VFCVKSRIFVSGFINVILCISLNMMYLCNSVNRE